MPKKRFARRAVKSGDQPQHQKHSELTDHFEPSDSALQVESTTVSKFSPKLASSSNIIALQRTLGNRATRRLIQTKSIQRSFKNKETEKQMQVRLTTHQSSLIKMLEKGMKSGDQLLKNSILWFTSGKNSLYAVVKTHDSTNRATALGKSGQEAFFGYPKSTLLPDRKTDLYNGDDPKDADNIQCEPDTVAGFNGGGTKIAIIEPADKREEDVFQTIRHEVQHSADRHNHNDTSTTLKKAQEGYKTEFRAYSLQGPGSSINFDQAYLTSSTYKVETWSISGANQHFNGNWPRKQWEIFSHLYNAKSYKYIKDQWDVENTIEDPLKRPFQQTVVKFTTPESLNPTNSVYLEEIYNGLDSVSSRDYEIDKDVADLKKLIGKLNEKEAKTLLASPNWKAARLNKYSRYFLQKELHATAKLPEPPSVLVTWGDSAKVRFFMRALGSICSKGHIDEKGEDATNLFSTYLDGSKALNQEQADFILKSEDWTNLWPEEGEAKKAATLVSKFETAELLAEASIPPEEGQCIKAYKELHEAAMDGGNYLAKQIETKVGLSSDIAGAKNKQETLNILVNELYGHIPNYRQTVNTFEPKTKLLKSVQGKLTELNTVKTF